MPDTPLDAMLPSMVQTMEPLLIMAFAVGIGAAFLSVMWGRGPAPLVFPLMAAFGLLMLRMMMSMLVPPGLETPAALSDVPDTDWSAVWSVLKGIGFGVSIPISLFALWRLSVWTRRGFVCFVSPPPRWLCRWLNRPIPPVIRPLPVAPYPLDTPVLLVLDDPIFAQIDHAIAAADRALKEDRLA